MSRETSAGTGKPYGLERVCRVLEFPRSTIYAQQARERPRWCPCARSGAARSRSWRMPTCWPPSAPTWPPRRSPARVTARSGRGCGSCAASGSPAPACCA